MITNHGSSTVGQVLVAMFTNYIGDFEILAEPIEPIEAEAVEVNSDGGEVISWVFDPNDLPDGEYRVDVAVDLSVDALTRAYSGRPGFGTAALAAGGVLTFSIPRVTPAEDYRALLSDLDGVPVVATTVLFHARRRPLFSSVYALRDSLPGARWDIGPSRPEDEEVA